MILIHSMLWNFSPSYMKDHPKVTTFPKRDLWSILKGTMAAYKNAEENIRAGFRCTGISPFSEEALLNRTLLFFIYFFIS